MKVSIFGPGHLTQMATVPIHNKTSSPEPPGRLPVNIKHLGTGTIKFI